MTSRERPSITSTEPGRRPGGRTLAMVWVLALVVVAALAAWLQVLGPPPAAQRGAPPATTSQAPAAATPPQAPAAAPK
jgi:hypothetical protein